MIARVKGWFRHSRTILAARLLHVAAGAVAAHDYALPYVTGQDWTPLSQCVPSWSWPMILVGLAVIFEWLRKVTKTPLKDRPQ